MSHEFDQKAGTWDDDPHADVHHGFDRDFLVCSLEGVGFQEVRVSTAHIMRRDRPGGVREHPLFLLTGQRRPHPSGDS